jgi:hypothetical protein
MYLCACSLCAFCYYELAQEKVVWRCYYERSKMLPTSQLCYHFSPQTLNTLKHTDKAVFFLFVTIWMLLRFAKRVSPKRPVWINNQTRETAPLYREIHFVSVALTISRNYDVKIHIHRFFMSPTDIFKLKISISRDVKPIIFIQITIISVPKLQKSLVCKESLAERSQKISCQYPFISGILKCFSKLRSKALLKTLGSKTSCN